MAPPKSPGGNVLGATSRNNMFEKGLSALVGTHCEHDSVVCFIKRKSLEMATSRNCHVRCPGSRRSQHIDDERRLALEDGSRWADLATGKDTALGHTSTYRQSALDKKATGSASLSQSTVQCLINLMPLRLD